MLLDSDIVGMQEFDENVLINIISLAYTHNNARALRASYQHEMDITDRHFSR
jgi:hypothetical protein